MANRPVFICVESKPFVKSENYEFTFYSGFSNSQKQKSIKSLHEAFNTKNTGKRILEISSKSTEILGVCLSAFNLKFKRDDKEYSVESLFQGSKVFENGGPYLDIYKKNAYEAKKDIRIKESGHIKEFCFFDDIFPREPKTYFYNWLYINALCSNPNYNSELITYDAFTDIEFNPKKSINCQAEAVAIYVSLLRAGFLSEAVKSKKNFLKIVYGIESCFDETDYKQMSLMDLM